MITSWALGAILGVVSSIPLGPINMSVAELSHAGRARELAWFIAGVLFADILVAALALFGILSAHLSTEVLRGVGVVGGTGFLLYGFVGLLRRRLVEPPAPSSATRTGASFMTGFLFCALNPGFYLFWIYGSSQLVAWSDAGPASSALFLLGVFCGDLVWFTVLSKALLRFRHKITPVALKTGSSALIALFGAIALWRSVHGSFTV